MIHFTFFTMIVSFILSFCASAPMNFAVISATLQHIKIQGAKDGKSIFYVLDLTAIPVNNQYYIPLTGCFDFSWGILKEISEIEITNERGQILNKNFSTIPNSIKGGFHRKPTLEIPWIKFSMRIDTCNSIENARIEINRIKRDFRNSTITSNCNYHFCRIFSYPKSKPLPKNIVITIDGRKRKIKGQVNNEPITVNIKNEPW